MTSARLWSAFGLVEPALLLVEDGQVAQAGGHVGMVGPRLFSQMARDCL